MGIRIHKAIGYGMPIGLFNFHFKPEMERDAESRTNWLYDKLIRNDETKAILDGDFDPDIIEELKELGYSEHSFFFKPYKLFGSEQPHSFARLFYTPSIEETEYIIFMPTMDFANRWMRHDDDIDYAVLRYSNKSDLDMRTTVIECNYGFYPFANYVRSTETDRPVQWDHTMMEQDGKRPDHIIPDVPPDMRYWLRKLDIMDNDGINKLRPVIATWWD